MPKTKKISKSSSNVSLLQKLESELKPNQSYLSLVLGLLIVLIAGILVVNYFKKGPSILGPAQQTSIEQQNQAALLEKYTVKRDDTLFNIAKAYYNDGYQYQKIAEANKLVDANLIEEGQVLEMPKIEVAKVEAALNTQGTGGAENQTIWGEKITGDTYTVIEGDWLSTISGRAYGDVMVFDKIAKANNIADPNLIEPGLVLKIPR